MLLSFSQHVSSLHHDSTSNATTYLSSTSHVALPLFSSNVFGLRLGSVSSGVGLDYSPNMDGASCDAGGLCPSSSHQETASVIL